MRKNCYWLVKEKYRLDENLSLLYSNYSLDKFNMDDFPLLKKPKSVPVLNRPAISGVPMR